MAIVLVPLLVAAWSPAREAAARDSGIRTTPGAGSVLVNKDVGEERWAISRDLASGSVTGNVWRGDGREPLFVWCEQVDAFSQSLTLDCFGAATCREAPCRPDAWTFVSQVQIAEDFFEAGDGGSDSCGGIRGLLCPKGWFCSYPPGDCRQPDAMGTCALLEQACACPRILAPVCGCDGQAYDNACLAACAGQSVLSEGKCG